MTSKIRFGYTPDPDDAFHFYALESGRISVAGVDRLEFECHHVQTLNRMAAEERLDVTAISSAFYPTIDDRYAILASGASVGRGYGPALAAAADRVPESLEGRRVAVPGLETTGCFLASYFHPGFDPVPVPFDRVAETVLAGEADAGVLIHEELMLWQDRGLVRMECLGERWTRATGLPLPVGLVVGHRRLGEDGLRRVQRALARSMEYALAHRDDALAHAFAFGVGAPPTVKQEFVDRFANQDTLRMPGDVRRALGELFRRGWEAGLMDHRAVSEVVG